ncbi:siroheme synthase CysG [Gallibacterium melopsittaci]|uniref:Siroheme synthase n=1 Tax=Gallibacterium melopsittaci TaxID=516063 RepID=A0ABV6HWA1_9PAST
MQYLPIFIDLKDKNVLVVGGGHIAKRKIDLLRQAHAKIQVVAEQLCSSLHALWQAGQINWLSKQFSADQLEAASLVVVATNDTALNQQVYQLAQQQNRLVNTVDDQTHCSFIFPSIIDRSPVQIAISSAGTAPVLTRLLREKLEALLPQHLSTMAEIAGRWRGKVKATLSQLKQRRYFWETLFNHSQFQRLTQNQQIEQAEQFIAEQLQQRPTPLGEVTLVGAGPGDAGLLTLKGLQAIQQADIVLYDALISEQILSLIRRDADRILVGKRAGKPSISQTQINNLLINYAKQGKRVVRLKGGDPFVFGRGGEELQALQQENIPFSVVPGVTAAVGATAYAGIPLTHRDYAQSVIFITGHRQANGNALAWKSLAQANTTLVVYMGTIKASEIQTQLLAHGRHPTTPVAVISQGTLVQQQVQIGTLTNLIDLAEQTEKPALLVIGEVVTLQQQLQWFGQPAIYSAPNTFQQQVA